MLESLFERCMKRRGVKESDPYDWEKSDATGNSNSSQGNNVQMQAKNEYLHGNVTQMTVAASNASGTDCVSLTSFFFTCFCCCNLVYVDDSRWSEGVMKSILFRWQQQSQSIIIKIRF